MAEEITVEEAIADFDKLIQSLNNLDRTFTTIIELDVNIDEIKKELTEDLKRELQGRSSYGIGI